VSAVKDGPVMFSFPLSDEARLLAVKDLLTTAAMLTREAAIIAWKISDPELASEAVRCLGFLEEEDFDFGDEEGDDNPQGQ